MNHSKAIIVTGMVFLTGSSTAFGEMMGLTLSELQNDSSDIVEGKVIRAGGHCSREKDGDILDQIAISIKVESVEKGSNVQVGQTVVAHAWRLRYRPGTSIFRYITCHGHQPIPAVGESVRAYLKLNRQTGKFEAMLPNGFESPNFGTMHTYRYFPSPTDLLFVLCPLWARILIFLVGIGSVFYVVRWRLSRDPQIREAQRKLQELAKHAH